MFDLDERKRLKADPSVIIQPVFTEDLTCTSVLFMCCSYGSEQQREKSGLHFIDLAFYREGLNRKQEVYSTVSGSNLSAMRKNKPGKEDWGGGGEKWDGMLE